MDREMKRDGEREGWEGYGYMEMEVNERGGRVRERGRERGGEREIEI